MSMIEAIYKLNNKHYQSFMTSYSRKHREHRELAILPNLGHNKAKNNSTLARMK